MSKAIALILIVFHQLFGDSIETSDVYIPKSHFAELQQFLGQRVNDFKLEFHRSFEETRINRKQKDNFLFSLPEKGVLIEEHLKVENISSVFPNHVFGNEAIRTWTVVQNNHYTYLFWGDSDGKLVLAEFKVSPFGPQVIILAQYMEKGNGVPLKSQFFLYDSFIWIVVSFKGKDREYLAVYQFNHNVLNRRQTIETDVKCDFDILSKGIIYMSVSSYMRKTPVGQTLQSTLKLYEWRHTQFDLIAEQKTHSATSVKLFNMAGTLYMALTQANDYHNYHISETVMIPKGSPVLLYNAREDEKLTYVQNIPTRYALKVEHFRVDGSNYLIFIDPKEGAQIYWWAGDQFLHYQDIQYSKNSFSVSVVRLPNAEILFAILFPDRIKFYTESVNSKYEMNGELVVHQSKNFETVKLFSYGVNHYFSLFTYDNSHKSRVDYIWKLNLVNQKVKDSDIYDPYNPLRSCLWKLEQTLSQREIELKQLTQRADRVWVANRHQNVSAPVIVKGKLTAKRLTTNLLIITNDKKVPQITNSHVKARAERLSNTLSNIVKDIPNVVYKSTNQTINSRILFTESLSAHQSNFGNIENRNLILNRIPFNVLSEDSLKLNANQAVRAHFTFNNLTVNNFDIRGLINNLNISDALLSDWPHLQAITGNHRYGDVMLLSDLLLHNEFGTINGIFPSELVTKSGANQQISGRKVFHLLEANNIDVSGTTNGIDLSDIADKAVLINGPNQVITGQMIMNSPIRVKRIKMNGLINRKVNVSEIAFNAVTIYGNQKITGRKTFRAPVIIRGNVEIGGNVNGIKLSDDVITTNTEQVITGKLTFKSLTNFMNNIECDFLNGIDLSEEVVRKSSSQPQIVNRKAFNETLVVLADITMETGSTVDGVDPSELNKLVISNRNAAFEATISFDELRVGGNIFTPTINNYPITDLPNILWLKSANQTIEVPIKLNGLVKFNHLFSNNVNGFRVPNDFVLNNDFNQLIVSPKTFAQMVFIDNDIEVSDGKRVNGIDLNWFERNNVKKDMESTDYIRGTKHFRSILVEGNIIAGTVNGLNISQDIMLTNKMQTINGNIRLSFPLTLINGNLHVMSNMNVRSTVNNVSLSRFSNEIVLNNFWPKSYQRPIRNKIFAAGISVNHMRADGTISGININEMKARVVTLNTKQEIYSSKNFSGVTSFRNDILSDYINGLHIHEFVNRVILKNAKTLVRGSKTLIGKTLFESNLELSGKVNGIDVRALQRRIMSRNRNNVILAPITFANDIHLGDLLLEPPATIDGLRTSDLALVGQDLRFNGNIIINRVVTVNGNVNVRKLVNGCDLRRLSADAVLHNTRHTYQSIHGSNQFSNLQVLGDVNINGLLNNVDINKLAAKVVTKSGEQVLTAPLVFEDDIHVENLIIKNLINGRNISLLFKDAVLKNRIQTIRGKKRFLNPLIVNGSRLHISGYINVNGLVNGIDLIELNQTAVQTNNKQEIRGIKTFSGSVTFVKDVFTVGPINGITIPNDLILVQTNQLIPGVTTFKSSLTGLKDLVVRKLVDGIDLSYFVSNRLTLSDNNELISSLLNFTSPVTVDNLIVKEQINKIPVNAFVTREGRHLINGLKTFANDIQVNGNIRSPGVYNGINIHDLANKAVNLFRPETIPGTTEFTVPVSMHQMVITGLLNGYDISNMADFHHKLTTEVDELINEIKGQLSSQEKHLVSQFDSHLYDRSTGLRHFELSQELSERIHINTSRPNTVLYIESFDGQRYAIFANETSKRYDNECNGNDRNPHFVPISIYRFNSRTYDHMQSIDIEDVVSLDSFILSNEVYLVIASRILSETYILQLRGYNMFEVIQSLPTPGVENVKSFWTNDGKLELEIVSTNSGQSKILTAIINGPHNVKKYETIEDLLHDSNTK